jgi:hypothetical protein
VNTFERNKSNKPLPDDAYSPTRLLIPMKTATSLLALLPAILLTSCYVTPEGGPYHHSGGGSHRASAQRPGGSYGSQRPGYDRDHRDNHRDRYDRDGRDRDWRERDDRNRDGRTSSSRYRGPGGPSSGVKSLPAGARRVEYRGSTYYTSGKTWYRASGSGYVPVSKPY